ncbi:hypothetical protein M0R04_07125 [Candidatus Dojkabacteria bacterium]|jgi:hypothetical protein|nr:hypothetical protein [Candidatus Dojkabacteria bacterium]
MDELLKKLLSADVLTEDTKVELEGAFKKQLDESLSVARATATAEVTAQLNEQWITERETLIEALDAKVTEALTSELDELREDIERFRDLEIEYAEKLVEAKSEMAHVLKGDIAQLIEKVDAFLEIRLTAELGELREDFEVVKKNQFGKTVFEAFVQEFQKHYVGDNSIESKLNETQIRLDDALTALEESDKRTAKLERTMKLKEVLAPLSGRTKEVMEAILKNVDTSLLEDAYKTFVGRVLKETTDTQSSEKEGKVLAEGKKEEVKLKGAVRKGNNDEQQLDESAIDKKDVIQRTTLTEADKAHMRRIAGIG